MGQRSTDVTSLEEVDFLLMIIVGRLKGLNFFWDSNLLLKDFIEFNGNITSSRTGDRCVHSGKLT